MGIREIFGHFLKKFIIRDHVTWFTCILWVLSGVCEKWPHGFPINLVVHVNFSYF